MSEEVRKRWEQMQIKTFTKWCNMHLAKKGESIEDVTTGFRDGVKLIELLEVIGEASLGKYNKKPRMRLHMIENLNKALAFIKERGVNLVSIGSEDICDGNITLTLGMIWTIILRFAISDLSEEGLSAKQGLLLWCQKKTKGYRDVDVKDFQDSFKDGLAFCALIHKHRPDLLDYDSLSKENPRENLDLAFDVAEKNLGVPKLLDTEDMLSLPRPDERSVMTYCAALYKVFSQYDKVEMAGQRIGKFVSFMKAAQDMIHDYEERAKALVAWAGESDAKYSTVPEGLDYQGIRAAVAAFKEYRRSEKAGKVAEQSDLASLLSSIQMKLKSMNRPAYVPPEGIATNDIDSIMDKLTSDERTYRTSLSAQLRQLLDKLRHAFADPANAFYDMLQGYKTFIGETLEGEFEEQKNTYQAKRDELAAHAPELDTIQAAEQACEDCNIEENEYSDHTWEDLKAAFDQMLKTMDKKIAFLAAQANESAGGVSADKMLEFQQSFDAFDEDHNHTLERLEFFACLASLGLAQVDFTGSNPESERIFQEVSEGTGHVSLEQYVKYVSSLVEDTFDPAAIAQSLRAIADGKDWVTEADMQRASMDAEQIDYVKNTLPMHSSGQGYDYSAWCQ